MNIFILKWPKFCSKIGMLGVLGVDNLHKKFGDDILKIADFFLIYLTVGGHFSLFSILSKTEKLPPKVRH